MMRIKTMMPPTPTITPVLFLDEFEFCVLAADVPLEGSEVVWEESKGPTVDEDDVACDDDVIDVDTADVDVDDTADVDVDDIAVADVDGVADELLLVVSPLERKTPLLLVQQAVAAVPFPQQ